MIETKRKRQVVEVEAAIVCDRCGTRIEVNDLEFQEIFRISHVGGYYSIFGDGNEVSVELCQRCFKELLGQFARVRQLNLGW